jgi:hypothetical protein
MKILHRITYDVKNSNKEIQVLKKDFEYFADACTFFREIKSTSISKPIIEEIVKYNKN